MAARKKYLATISIVLPTDLRRALDAIADDENDSLGVIVRRACIREVDRVARLKAKRTPTTASSPSAEQAHG